MNKIFKSKKIMALFLTVIMCIGSVTATYAYDEASGVVSNAGYSVLCSATVNSKYENLNLSISSGASNILGIPQATVRAECYVYNTSTGQYYMVDITKTFDITDIYRGRQIQITEFNTGNYQVQYILYYDIVFSLYIRQGYGVSNSPHIYLSNR